MNRRHFLSRLATAAAGAFIATNLPLGVLPEPAQRYVVCERLRNVFNARMRGKGSADLPVTMFVSQPVFDGYEREMTEISIKAFGHACLFSGRNGGLMFKGVELRSLKTLRGWDMAFEGRV